MADNLFRIGQSGKDSMQVTFKAEASILGRGQPWENLEGCKRDELMQGHMEEKLAQKIDQRPVGLES